MGYEGEGLHSSLMRAQNPALSLRTTVCPVEDSSPRWSNSHALTRDPRGGRHSPGTRKCSEEEAPEEHPSVLSRLREPSSRDRRDPGDRAGSRSIVCPRKRVRVIRGIEVTDADARSPLRSVADVEREASHRTGGTIDPR